MLYVCDVCLIKPISRITNWIDHYNTKKHQSNLCNATHICLNCYSAFIFDKKSPEYKKMFEKHMCECKENIICRLSQDKKNDNDEKDQIIEKLKEENMKFIIEIKILVIY